MTWKPYRGEDYLDFPAVEAWCRAAAAAFPDRVILDELGRTAHGRPLLMLSIALADGGIASTDLSHRTGFWLDGGTHCAEWTGVMSALHTVSTWLVGLRDGDDALTAWFARNVVYVVPCVSPDGYQAMHDGAPFIRSTLRPPRQERLRFGLEPGDIDGDGAVRWMRWKHPAGSWVADPEHPLAMRPRTIDDDPADAWFRCQEGRFIAWDGVRWTQAPLKHGLDLNRNFPSNWAPFEMFGMDSGQYPGSAPESAAIMRTVADRPNIAAAVTNHTYTGCLLTEPHRPDGALGDGDIDLMQRLAEQAVEGTGYRVFKVHPEFTYDDKKPVVGVWSDSLCDTYGVPAWTLELWDPYGFAGVETQGACEVLPQARARQAARGHRCIRGRRPARAAVDPLRAPPAGSRRAGRHRLHAHHPQSAGAIAGCGVRQGHGGGRSDPQGGARGAGGSNADG